MTNRDPKPVALIREADCIGCTKCIQACPVDAIIGSHQLMHTVIAAECIGCRLCLPPCPVDCIELVPAQEPVDPVRTRERVLARKARQAVMIPVVTEDAADCQDYVKRFLHQTIPNK